MPSWQARFMNASVRILIRRRNWGDEAQLVRRARRLFGSPPPYAWLRTIGLRVVPTGNGEIAGEWLIPSNANGGVILYLHGGGYVSCSPTTHRPITAALARLTGCRVFGLDYRLAPEHRFPAAIDDCVAAYRWLLEQGIPSSTLYLAGDSAGGGLVFATLVRARDGGIPLPAAAVCFSPWTDLAATGESISENDGRCAMFRPENMKDYARIYLGDASPRNPLASPLLAELAGLPPVLLQVGSTELLRDDSQRIHDRILNAGGSSQLEIFDDCFHCWQMLDGIVPEARTALRHAAEFLMRH